MNGWRRLGVPAVCFALLLGACGRAGEQIARTLPDEDVGWEDDALAGRLASVPGFFYIDPPTAMLESSRTSLDQADRPWEVLYPDRFSVHLISRGSRLLHGSLVVIALDPASKAEHPSGGSWLDDAAARAEKRAGVVERRTVEGVPVLQVTFPGGTADGTFRQYTWYEDGHLFDLLIGEPDAESADVTAFLTGFLAGRDHRSQHAAPHAFAVTDFATEDIPFAVETGGDFALRVEDGTYELRATDRWAASRFDFAEGAPQANPAAIAITVDAAPWSESMQTMLWGTGCFDEGSGIMYALSRSVRGATMLLRAGAQDKPGFTTIAESSGPTIPARGRYERLRLECRAGPDGVQLTGSVDGRPVVSAVDPAGPDRFDQVWVGAHGEDGGWRFDDLVVENLDPRPAGEAFNQPGEG